MIETAETDSTAAAVRRRVLATKNRLWRVEDFEGSPQAVISELRRLVAKGELMRARRGLYWRGKRTRFGMLPPSRQEAIETVLAEEDAVGATGWHAANLLGLSTQVAPVEALAVTRRPPEGLPGVRLVDRSARSGRRRARLNRLEVTLLEALEGWERFVEVDAGEATRRLAGLLDDDRVRVDRLVRASTTEPAKVRERLRMLLREAGKDELAERIPPARDIRTRRRALSVIAQ